MQRRAAVDAQECHDTRFSPNSGGAFGRAPNLAAAAAIQSTPRHRRLSHVWIALVPRSFCFLNEVWMKPSLPPVPLGACAITTMRPRNRIRAQLDLWNERVGESGLFFSLLVAYWCSQAWFFVYGVKYALSLALPSDWSRYMLIFGRGFGYVATFNALLLPITVNRTLTNILYRLPLYDIFSVARWLPDLHAIIARWFTIAGWIHGILLSVAYGVGTLPFRGGFLPFSNTIPTTMVFVTGCALMAFLLAIVLLSLGSVRRRVYRVFWASHVPLAILTYAALVFHGLRGGRLWSVYFFGLPVVLYILDRLYHSFAAAFTPHRVLSVELSHKNSNVVRLVLERRGRKFVAGQYFKLAWKFHVCSHLAVAGEWHPFTVASSPLLDKDRIIFFIAATGKWTNALRALALQQHQQQHDENLEHASSTSPTPKSLATEAMPHAVDKSSITTCLPINRRWILLSGPYGAPAQSHQNFAHQLLIGTGVGASPMFSIVQELCGRATPCDNNNNNDASLECSDVSTGGDLENGTLASVSDTTSPTRESTDLPNFEKLKASTTANDSSSEVVPSVQALPPVLAARLGTLRGDTFLDRFSAAVLSNLWLFSILWICLADLTVSICASAFSHIVAFIGSLALFVVILTMICLTVIADMRLSVNPPRWHYVLLLRGILLLLWFAVALTNAVLCSLLIVEYFLASNDRMASISKSSEWLFVMVVTPVHITIFVLLLFFFFLPRSWTWRTTVTAKVFRRCLQGSWDHQQRSNKVVSDARNAEWNAFSHIRTVTFVWVVRYVEDLWFLEKLYELASQQDASDPCRPRLRIHVHITRLGHDDADPVSSRLPANCGEILQFHCGRPDFGEYVAELVNEDHDTTTPLAGRGKPGAPASIRRFQRTRAFSNKVHHGIFFCGGRSVVRSVHQSIRAVAAARAARGLPQRNVFFMKENF
jgi:NAD(P)H-flavin reductase